MHDPMTLAHTFPFFEIWHVDPQTDGSDDSCGYTYPRMSKQRIELIKKLANEEHSFFFDKSIGGYAMEPIAIIYNVARIIRWRVHHKSRLKQDDYYAMFQLAYFTGDNIRTYCNASYHSPQDFERVFFIVAADMMRRDRPWWKHPKWHVHHWKIIFTPWRRYYNYTIKRKAQEVARR